MSDRLRVALNKWWKKQERDQWIYGKLGKITQAGSYLFDVPGRKTFIYVSMREASGVQTVVAARNDAGLPHAPRLNVRMKLEYGVYVIYGKAGRQDLGENPETDPSGVEVHNHDSRYYEKFEFIDLSDGVADAGSPVKLNADGFIDPSMVDTSGIAGEIEAEFTDSATIDFTIVPGTSITAIVINDSITFAKMQNIATDKLLGRDTASTGDIEQIGLGASLSFDGSGNIQRAALTGDVSASANSNTTTIANDAVTYAKMQNVSATDRVLGRFNTGAGDVEEITFTAAARALADDADAAAMRTTLGLVAAGAGDIWVEKAGDTMSGELKLDTTLNLSNGTQDYVLDGDGADAIITAQTAATAARLRLHAFDADGTDEVALVIYGKGKKGATTNTETLSLSWNVVGGTYIIQSTAAGTGTIRPLQINVGANTSQVSLATSGKVGFGGSPAAVVNIFGGSITTGETLRVERDLGSASTNSPLVNFIQDNTGDDQSALRVQQDGTGNILELYDGATLVVSVADGGTLSGQTAAFSRIYLKEDGSVSGAQNVYFHERPSGTNRRLMVYGPAQSNAFGMIVAPTDTTAQDVNIGLWESDIDGGATNYRFAGMSIRGNSDAGTLQFSTSKNGSGVAGDMEYVIDTVTVLRLYNVGKMAGFGGLTSYGATNLGMKAGASTNDAAVGGVLYLETGSTGNVGAGEDDLKSYTVPADTLNVNGQGLFFEMWGTTANNANSKTIKLKFGSNSYTLAATTNPAVSWSVRGYIIRTGAATQEVFAEYKEGSTLSLTVSTASRTLSGTNILKLTGEATSNNDIVQRGFITKWFDANT